MRLEPHRFGVDRDRAGVARQVGQVAAMQADGHGLAPSFRVCVIMSVHKRLMPVTLGQRLLAIEAERLDRRQIAE